jgi:hypothetical protein
MEQKKIEWDIVCENGTMRSARGTLKKWKFSVWDLVVNIGKKLLHIKRYVMAIHKDLSSTSYIRLACWRVITIALSHNFSKMLCKL